MSGPDPRYVRASDDQHPADWTPGFEVFIGGFDRVFLAEARKAADRAGEGLRQRDSTAVAGAAAAAVLLATAACEARLSEYLTEHAKEIGESAVNALRQEPDAFKQWRALLAQRAPTYPLDSSSPVACLFRLRDLVAHRNARFMRLGEWPEKLKDCVAKNAIPVHKSNEIDWTSGVYVHQVAMWAYQTATDWLTAVSSLGVRDACVDHPDL
jgi:hypothetical protein